MLDLGPRQGHDPSSSPGAPLMRSALSIRVALKCSDGDDHLAFDSVQARSLQHGHSSGARP